MRETVRFLVNPSAGGGRARRVLSAVEAAAAARGASVELSESARDLTARAARARDEQVARVVVVGGDGSVHLVVQALATSGCELAVVPTGRGDDFATCLGVPRDPAAALELAFEGRARQIDLIRIARSGAEPVWGGLYASLGFDSAVTRTANAQPRWIPRSATYVLAALRTLIRFRASRLTVVHDAGRIDRRAMFVTTCNAPLYGGGMLIAPEAEMTDGRLDIVVVDRIGKPSLLRIFPRVFSGRHVDHPAVSIVRSRSVRIAAQPAVLLASDGEVEGEVGDEGVELSVVPGALRAVAGVPLDD